MNDVCQSDKVLYCRATIKMWELLYVVAKYNVLDGTVYIIAHAVLANHVDEVFVHFLLISVYLAT